MRNRITSTDLKPRREDQAISYRSGHDEVTAQWANVDYISTSGARLVG